MNANLAEHQSGRRAAVRHAMDVLRLCLLGRPRGHILGYASSGTERGHLSLDASRWKALSSAVERVLRPLREPEPASAAEWVLTREAGGWAIRASSDDGEPSYFTAAIPADDQNAAFDWATDVTPEVDRKGIRYSGPPPM